MPKPNSNLCCLIKKIEEKKVIIKVATNANYCWFFWLYLPLNLSHTHFDITKTFFVWIHFHCNALHCIYVWCGRKRSRGPLQNDLWTFDEIAGFKTPELISFFWQLFSFLTIASVQYCNMYLIWLLFVTHSANGVFINLHISMQLYSFWCFEFLGLLCFTFVLGLACVHPYTIEVALFFASFSLVDLILCFIVFFSFFWLFPLSVLA